MNYNEYFCEFGPVNAWILAYFVYVNFKNSGASRPSPPGPSPKCCKGDYSYPKTPSWISPPTCTLLLWPLLRSHFKISLDIFAHDIKTLKGSRCWGGEEESLRGAHLIDNKSIYTDPFSFFYRMVLHLYMLQPQKVISNVSEPL